MAEPDQLSGASLPSPLFIVGSPRSGTSILAHALLRAGYHGFVEGNFLSLLRAFDLRTDFHREVFANPGAPVLAGQIDWDAFKASIFQVFRTQVEAHHPVSPWLDKTGNPDMIEAIPIVLKLWPGAVFVYAKRRALENIVSRLVKFPQHDFEYHCRDWSRNMAAWRGLRASIGARAIEIDQQEIAQAPEFTAARLTNFIHATGPMRIELRRAFIHRRPQQTSPESATRIFDLDTIGWSPAQKDVFLGICGEEMRQFNYATDRRYWLDPDRAALRPRGARLKEAAG